MTTNTDTARKAMLDEYWRQIEKAQWTLTKLPAHLRHLYRKETEAFFNDPHRYD